MKILRLMVWTSVWILVAGTLFPAFAANPETVEFFSGALAPDRSHPPDKIGGFLSKPEGAGPFPALVHLHGCAGLKLSNWELQKRLVKWGYVSLLVESIGTRGLLNICGGGSRVTKLLRAHDAYGALKYLQRLPFVDASRIGVIGFSHGGGGVFYALEPDRADFPHPSSVFTTVPTIRFKAAIAYYPRCWARKTTLYAPLLILIGEADDWTLALLCREMAEHSMAGGKPIELVVYPGVTHGFDMGFDEIAFGHRIVYDHAATEDSIRQVKAFLAKNL